MTRPWQKHGLVYSPSADRHPKLRSHAANPLPVLIEGDIYRVFFSGRDSENRSSVGAVDIDVVRGRVVREYFEPFFQHGPEGSFYADGISIGNCYDAGGMTYMLFMGWQTAASSHWRGDIGRLLVKPDLTLVLDSDKPFIGSSETDPISLSYPWVLRAGNGDYRMWYGSTVSWDAGNGEMLHVINYATSADGEDWRRHGLSVPCRLGTAQAYSRPTVVRDDDGFHMWFSYRGGTRQKYRIGYASSATGETWDLKLDEAGIDVSPTGWDSEMIEYPFVFDHEGRRYMLYNGNGYGLSGIGIATQELR